MILLAIALNKINTLHKQEVLAFIFNCIFSVILLKNAIKYIRIRAFVSRNNYE